MLAARRFGCPCSIEPIKFPPSTVKWVQYSFLQVHGAMLPCTVYPRLLNNYNGCFWWFLIPRRAGRRNSFLSYLYIGAYSLIHLSKNTLQRSWNSENENCETSKQRRGATVSLRLVVPMRVLSSHAHRRGTSVLQRIRSWTVLPGEDHCRHHGLCVCVTNHQF